MITLYSGLFLWCSAFVRGTLFPHWRSKSGPVTQQYPPKQVCPNCHSGVRKVFGIVSYNCFSYDAVNKYRNQKDLGGKFDWGG